MNNTNSRLDLQDPLILRLSDKYNLRPYFVAYLRSAMKTGLKTYNKEDLIVHIQEDNIKRLDWIRQALDRSDIDARFKTIKIFRLARESKFRYEVIDFLEQGNDEIIADICQ